MLTTPGGDQDKVHGEQDIKGSKLIRKKSLGKLGRVFHLAQSKSKSATAYQENRGQDTFIGNECDSIAGRHNHRELPRQASPYHTLGQPSQASTGEGFGLSGNDIDDDETCGEDEDEEDPDPALLGSVDYHNFLGGTSGRKAKFIWSSAAASRPSASTPEQAVDSDGIIYSSSSARQTAFQLQPSKESLISGPSNQIL